MTHDIHEEGVSEVIGAVLLVGLTVLGVAIVVAVLLAGPQTAEIPHATIVAGNESGNIALAHEGGDPLNAGEYRIYLDTGNGLVDETANFTTPPGGVWSIGEAINYTGGAKPGRVVVTAVTGGRETILAEPAFDAGGTTVFAPDLVEPGSFVGPVAPSEDESAIIIVKPVTNSTATFTHEGTGNGKYLADFSANVTADDVTRVDLIVYYYPDDSKDKWMTQVYRNIPRYTGTIFTEQVTIQGNAHISNGEVISVVFLAYNETSLIGMEALKTTATVVN
jgi:hypothetical protein